MINFSKLLSRNKRFNVLGSGHSEISNHPNCLCFPTHSSGTLPCYGEEKLKMKLIHWITKMTSSLAIRARNLQTTYGFDFDQQKDCFLYHLPSYSVISCILLFLCVTGLNFYLCGKKRQTNQRVTYSAVVEPSVELNPRPRPRSRH